MQLLHSIVIRTHCYSYYNVVRNLNYQIVQLLNKKKKIIKRIYFLN